MQLVNSCVSKISKNYKPDETSIFDTPIDIPEYLLDSIRSEETAETSETWFEVKMIYSEFLENFL